MRVQADGAMRRAAYTYCALPPMRPSITAGVTLAYCDSACAKA